MKIRRVCGLSIVLAALALSGGCSSLKSKDASQASDSGTTSTSPGSEPAIATGAHEGVELSSEGLANATKAAKAGLGVGQNTVHFAYDSDVLSQSDMALLRKHAEFIKANPRAAVRLEGHTDERGTQEYNMALGERRAKAVAVFLQAHGVAPHQLEIVSYGELKPAAAGEDEAAMAQNRRVEVLHR